MTFSGILAIIIVLLILYYIGLFGWDQYQLAQSEKESTEVHEEDIDITSDLLGEDNQPTNVEVTPDYHKLKTEKPQPEKFPFPWTSEQIKNAFEKIKKKQDVKELEDIEYYDEDEFNKAI